MRITEKTLFIVVKYTRSLGASEDLVVAAAESLARQGDAPSFWFNFRPKDGESRINRLRQAGCSIFYFDNRSPLLRMKRKFSPVADRMALVDSLRFALKNTKPEKVILNQGGNSDASIEAKVLQQEGASYVVLCHCATESSWPNPDFLPAMRSIFTGAKHCLFVSQANQELTEAQIGSLIESSSVVYNPCKFQSIQETTWPDPSEGFSLAVVARIENKQKGHDLILQTLALPVWRKRPITVTFYGEGPHRAALESYAKALKLDSVSFAGHVRDIDTIWNRHHAFIQASRYEGYGLSLVEAMFCQRMAISTRIPAAEEFIIDGETGFLSRSASVAELSDTIERAWAQRHHWQMLGQAAAKRVESTYPEHPVDDFIERIKEIG